MVEESTSLPREPHNTRGQRSVEWHRYEAEALLKQDQTSKLAPEVMADLALGDVACGDTRADICVRVLSVGTDASVAAVAVPASTDRG